MAMLRWVFLALILFSVVNLCKSEAEEQGSEAVLTLDANSFSEALSSHPFIVVEFYAPWCGHCKRLAPEYEKAAAILKNHDPPIVLAKVDANEETKSFG